MRRAVLLFGALSEVAARQPQHVLAPLTHRRDVQVDQVDPVVQVFAKPPLRVRRHDGCAGKIGCAQRRVSRITQVEVGEPVVDQVSTPSS